MPQDNWKNIFENQMKLRDELIERVKKGVSNFETKEQKEDSELHARMAEDAVTN